MPSPAPDMTHSRYITRDTEAMYVHQTENWGFIDRSSLLLAQGFPNPARLLASLHTLRLPRKRMKSEPRVTRPRRSAHGSKGFQLPINFIDNPERLIRKGKSNPCRRENSTVNHSECATNVESRLAPVVSSLGVILVFPL
jgi:hypothetical protein